MSAVTLPAPTVSPSDVDGEERDRHAHVVRPKSVLTEALVTGQPVTALCGKTWVPSRAPERYPLCPTCKEVCDAAGLTVPGA